LTVHLTPADAESIRDRYYRDVRGAGYKRSAGQTGIGGAEEEERKPFDEPLWIESILDRLVWESVVPAVAAGQADRDADSVVDVSNWVISDRHPSKLEHTRPTEPAKLPSSAGWSW
jgi:hypothetical protein